jgi:hypothetical protein
MRAGKKGEAPAEAPAPVFRAECSPVGGAARGHDPLVAAVIAKLPSGGAWPREARIAWLKMAALAFDVSFGAEGGIEIAATCDPDHGERTGAVHPATAVPVRVSAPAPPKGDKVYSIDAQGFALCNGLAIDMHELPMTCEIVDYRTGMEFGDVAGIMWKSSGYSDRPLPASVTLVAPTGPQPGRGGLPAGGVS